MLLKETNSPLNEKQSDYLNALLPTLTDTQKIWLSGFLVASPSAPSNAAVPEVGQPDTVRTTQTEGQTPVREVTILYGSETGNAQGLAEEMENKLQSADIPVKTSAMDDFKAKKLKKVEDLLMITATHGEGDPPDNAVAFHEFLFSRKAPSMKGKRFSVLSLGDESYEFFCKAGIDFDERLEELGGERIQPRVDCDLDFDEPAEAWYADVLDTLAASSETSSTETSLDQGTGENGNAADHSSTDTPAYSRKNPFSAEVLENMVLSGRGSAKENRHVELSLEGSGFTFEPGDSLGIVPENDPTLVDAVIEEMDWVPDETVQINKKEDILSLRESLLTYFDITTLTKPLVEKAAAFTTGESLAAFARSSRDVLFDYFEGRDLLDLLQDFGPWNADPHDFIKILRKMPARLYSIASSYEANPDEVHLTLGTVRYQSHDRDRTGVCTGQFSDRIQAGESVPVYIHRNPNFKFPEDAETPVIMIGPGTGVAPFRSFLEDCEEKEIESDTWLFFGDQHFRSDFLYQVDWQNWLQEGVLSRMDVAFSRDYAEKVYVQHRMKEKSRELYEWLQKGAHIYVCGDEERMAKDVHQTLQDILVSEGGYHAEEASEYLTQMKQEKRYQRDVY